MTPKAAFDWTAHLHSDERLLWSGSPELDSLLIPGGIFLAFGLIGGPIAFLGLLIPLGMLLFYARDAYALTKRRVLAHSQPFGSQPRLKSSPRAGVYARPQFSRGPRAVVFTGPDRSKIMFYMLSRETQHLLIDSYPKGGPLPKERPAP